MSVQSQIHISSLKVDFTTRKVVVQEASDFQHRNVDVTEFLVHVVNKMSFLI